MEAKKFPDYLQAVDDLLSSNPKPGELVTHEWLDEHLGLSPNMKKYGITKMQRVSALRKELLMKHQIDLKSVVGQGYYIVAPQDQTELALEDTIAAIRRAANTGLMRAVNVKRAELSAKEQEANAIGVTALAAIGPTISGSLMKSKRPAISEGNK